MGMKMDAFYDTYFFHTCESMYTERGFGRIKRMEIAGGHRTL